MSSTFTILMGFLFTITMGFLFTIVLGIQFTISITSSFYLYLLRKCVETMPEHVYAHFYLSQILYKKGDFHKALEHIGKAKANFEFMADLHAYSYQQYIS